VGVDLMWGGEEVGGRGEMVCERGCGGGKADGGSEVSHDEGEGKRWEEAAG